MACATGSITWRLYIGVHRSGDEVVVRANRIGAVPLRALFMHAGPDCGACGADLDHLDKEPIVAMASMQVIRRPPRRQHVPS